MSPVILESIPLAPHKPRGTVNRYVKRHQSIKPVLIKPLKGIHPVFYRSGWRKDTFAHSRNSLVTSFQKLATKHMALPGLTSPRPKATETLLPGFLTFLESLVLVSLVKLEISVL